MPEEFLGTQEVNAPLKPDQETLRDRQDIIDPIDISAMDDMAKKLMEDKEKQAADEAEAAKKAQEEAEAAAAAEAAKTDEEKEADRKAAEEAAAAEAAKTDEEKEAERKAAEEAAAAEGQEGQEGQEGAEGQKDPYDDVQLPPNARGKSAEAFATLKQRFATDLGQRDEEITKLKQQVEQFQSGNPIPDETQKELEDLRVFRARLDLQADPEFTKKYDGKIDTLNEFIYAQLKGVEGIGDAHIAKFRELGGFHMSNYEDILEKLNNPQVTRLVQGKLDEIAVTQFERDRALNASKEDVQKYVEEKREQYNQSLTAHHEVTKKELEKIYTEKMPWLQDPNPPKTGDKNAQVIHDDTVKFNKNVRENMAIAASDDAPEMRAILIAGMGQLLYLKRQYGFLQAAFNKLEKDHKAASDELAKIKRASSNRLDKSIAPPNPETPKPKMDLSSNGAEALDALRKEQLTRQ